MIRNKLFSGILEYTHRRRFKIGIQTENLHPGKIFYGSNQRHNTN